MVTFCFRSYGGFEGVCGCSESLQLLERHSEAFTGTMLRCLGFTSKEYSKQGETWKGKRECNKMGYVKETNDMCRPEMVMLQLVHCIHQRVTLFVMGHCTTPLSSPMAESGTDISWALLKGLHFSSTPCSSNFSREELAKRRFPGGGTRNSHPISLAKAPKCAFLMRWGSQRHFDRNHPRRSQHPLEMRDLRGSGGSGMTIKQGGPPEGSGSSFREERTAAHALRRHGQGTRCEAQKQQG